MFKKLLYWLRWITVLPGALITTLSVMFSLNWILNLISLHITHDIVNKLYAFLMVIIFILVGCKIAPKYKLKTAIVLCGIYVIPWSTVCIIGLFFTDRIRNAEIQFLYNTIITILGALIGILIVRKLEKNNFI